MNNLKEPELDKRLSELLQKEKQLEEQKQKIREFKNWLQRRKLGEPKNPNEILEITKKKFAEDFDNEICMIIEKFDELWGES